MDEAAIDFGEIYGGYSDYLRIEIGSLIYPIIDEHGNTMYTYSNPVFGDAHVVDCNDSKEKSYGTRPVAAVHTHPNSPNFSPDDLEWARSPHNWVNFYMVHDSTIKVYEKVGLSDLNLMEWKERSQPVTTTLEVKEIPLAIKFVLAMNYSSVWSEHFSEACEAFDCENKSWPNEEYYHCDRKYVYVDGMKIPRVLWRF